MMFGLSRIREHTFVSQLLAPTSLVVDLGMNRGHFADQIQAQFGCRVVGAEPNPLLRKAIKEHPQRRTSGTAIGETAGELPLFISPDDDEASSLITRSIEECGSSVQVGVETLEQFLRRHEALQADLIKVDIEGAELPVLEQLDLLLLDGVAQLSVEFHVFLDPTIRPRIANVISRFEAHGYQVIDFSTSYMDVLFVNSRRLKLGALVVAQWQLRKFLYGAVRRISNLTDSSSRASFVRCED